MEPAHTAGRIEALVIPNTRDLGDGFRVRRALPSSNRRMVGPFVFFDEMGPATFAPGRGLDVRPHPHIGLATVTYLFEGEILHRDSLGTVQPIRPGEVNWMIAGRGIVHSERTPAGQRAAGSRVAGIQTWIALPRRHEECTPGFVHHGAADLPVFDDLGLRVRVIAGSLYGARSPVRTFSEMFYADVWLGKGARLAIPEEPEERAAYIVDGSVIEEASEARYGRGELIVFRPHCEVTLLAPDHADARLMLFGGDPLDGPRHVWWNFVSSSRERIEQAKVDWEEGRFGEVPGESEFIPLPERTAGPVHYP
jgi:redox-sensitive bicupin YhaK (pirin superfamily)